MIRRLDRLVSSSYLKLFLVFVISAPSLFIVAELTEQLREFVETGLTWQEILFAYVYRLPHFILLSFPIASLIAAVFTVHSMTIHREILAAKAGGVSFRRLVVPVLIWSTVLSGIGLSVTDLVSSTNRISSDILRREANRPPRRANFVYQTEDRSLLSIGQLSAINGTLSGVVLDGPPENVDGEEIRIQIQAMGAQWTENEGWLMENGYLRVLSEMGWDRSYAFRQLRTRSLTERPEELLEVPRDADEMTTGEIERQVAILTRAGGEPRKLMVEGEQRFAIPVATMVVALFGAPLATTSKRGGAAFGIGVSLGTTIFYILILRLSGALGEAGTLSPFMAAWIPNIAFFFVGGILLSRVRT